MSRNTKDREGEPVEEHGDDLWRRDYLKLAGVTGLGAAVGASGRASAESGTAASMDMYDTTINNVVNVEDDLGVSPQQDDVMGGDSQPLHVVLRDEPKSPVRGPGRRVVRRN